MFLRTKRKKSNMKRAASYVPPSGDIQTAKFVLVGEQPGRREVISRRPFVGPAGRVLDECLMVVGIQRSKCYFTNVIKDLDRPLSYYFKSTRSGPTLSREGLDYLRSLENELSQASPTAIFIPIGNVALWALAERSGITKWRGSVLKIKSRIVIPIIHPATVIPPKNVYTNKLLIQYDLQKAKRISDKGYFPLECKLHNRTVIQRLYRLVR
jgi:uracil-DNA glycosylase family 4